MRGEVAAATAPTGVVPIPRTVHSLKKKYPSHLTQVGLADAPAPKKTRRRGSSGGCDRDFCFLQVTKLFLVPIVRPAAWPPGRSGTYGCGCGCRDSSGVARSEHQAHRSTTTTTDGAAVAAAAATADGR